MTPGDSGKLISGNILLPGEVLHGGQVLLNGDGLIVCVDCDCSDEAGADTATAIVCPEGAVSPGLIDAHNHLSFANASPHAFTSERYEGRHDWRVGNDGHTQIPTIGNASAAQKQWWFVCPTARTATTPPPTGPWPPRRRRAPRTTD